MIEQRSTVTRNGFKIWEDSSSKAERDGQHWHTTRLKHRCNNNKDPADAKTSSAPCLALRAPTGASRVTRRTL